MPYAQLQQVLMENPEAGDVMPNCGGLRKIRTADSNRGKGKRGGARVIYLSIPEASHFYMLDIYGKDEQDDIPPKECKSLSRLAAQIKEEVIESYRRWKGTSSP